MPERGHNRKSKQLRYVAKSLSWLFMAMPAGINAQAYVPPPIPNKDVDAYGVELKSGRFTGQSPDVVSIGDEPHRMKVHYQISDMLYFASNFYGSVVAYPTSYFVEAKFDQYSERFTLSGRHDTSDQTVSYANQLHSGSMLYRTFDGVNYTYVLVLKNGKRVEYRPTNSRNQVLAVYRITEPDGYQITIDDGSTTGGQSTFYRDNKGYQIKLYRPANQGYSLQAINASIDYCSGTTSSTCSGPPARIGSVWGTQITDPTGRITTYSYSSLLISTGLNQTNYIYPLSSIDFPGGGKNEVAISYNYPSTGTPVNDDVTISSVMEGGVNVSYTYNKEPISTGYGPAEPGYNRTTTASVGGVTLFSAKYIKPPVSAASSPRQPATMLTYTDGLGRLTSLQSDGIGQTVGETLPGGWYVRHTFDDRNNIVTTTQSGAGGPYTTTRTFPSSCTLDTQAVCNQPTAIKDPNSGTTDYEYNARGQVTAVTLPAPVVNGVRPRTEYTYVMRTAYIKDVSGNPVAAGPAISMLSHVSSCRSQNKCAGSSDETSTDYDYGPVTGLNNLQLRGMTVTSQGASGTMEARTTCYTYNYFGEKIAETAARAGVSKCP